MLIPLDMVLPARTRNAIGLSQWRFSLSAAASETQTRRLDQSTIRVRRVSFSDLSQPFRISRQACAISDGDGTYGASLAGLSIGSANIGETDFDVMISSILISQRAKRTS